MKKNILFLLIKIVVLFSSNLHAQNIDQLMQRYNNSYILEHTNLFSKQEHLTDARLKDIFAPPTTHRSLKIENVDNVWLENITNLIKQNPSVIYPYLRIDSQNLAAYIILLHVFDIDMPAYSKEAVAVNFIKKYLLQPEVIKNYEGIENKPTNISNKDYFVNIVWGEELSSGI